MQANPQQFLEEYDVYCATHGTPERIEVMLCDVNAVLRGKWIAPTDAVKLAKGGMRLPLSTYAPSIFGLEVGTTGLGIITGDRDAELRPILGTLSPIAWGAPNAGAPSGVTRAQVMVEMFEEGEVSGLSPRRILNDVVARFSGKNLTPIIAVELEFYLFKKRDSLDAPPEPIEPEFKAQNYDLEVLERHQILLERIKQACALCGLNADILIAEFGPGQFEINFHHSDDVLAGADRAVLFCRLVRGIASEQGVEATFMAKPYADFAGNGMHVHCSVLDGAGDNIFHNKGAPKGIKSGSDSRDALTPRLKHAVAGLLETMPDMQAIFAPHLNSYRRIVPTSFAPSRPNWAIDHREAAVRVIDPFAENGRLEHRICGADVNPYLAIAAILGGMDYGLAESPDLPPALDDAGAVAVPNLSHDWRTAIEQFADAEHAGEVFTPYYRHIYSQIRRFEADKINQDITPAEYRYYLSRL